MSSSAPSRSSRSAATTVACGSDSDDSSSDATTTTAASKAIKAPDSITIAYQAIPNGDLIVKQQKLLEKALPDTKIDVEAVRLGRLGQRGVRVR